MTLLSLGDNDLHSLRSYVHSNFHSVCSVARLIKAKLRSHVKPKCANWCRRICRVLTPQQQLVKSSWNGEGQHSVLLNHLSTASSFSFSFLLPTTRKTARRLKVLTVFFKDGTS